jgi:TolB-like protein
VAVADTSRLALVPLLNLSKYEEAGDIVANSLLVALLDIGTFDLVSPGDVKDVILRKRIRFTDRLPIETMQELGRELNCGYLLMGTINQYDMVTDKTEMVPVISLSLRIVESTDGAIVWAATHTRRGNDTESVFGVGRIKTLEQLASVTVREITDTMK